MQKPKLCVVCTSPHMLWVRALDDGPGRPAVDLYFCVACRSAASPQAEPVPSHSALQWHLGVTERNTRYALNLFGDLGISRPMVLDIGCGSGTLLDTARSLGGGGVGFDIDAPACAHGRARGLDLRAELWRPDTPLPAVNLITCIMVLEHLHQPRALLGELLAAARHHACPLFVAVPFLVPEWWRYLHEPLGEDFHPFRQPRVHVTHFSPEGLETAARQLGAVRCQPMYQRADWPGFLLHAC